jgi:hypothetical protein
MLKLKCHLVCSGPNDKGGWVRAVLAHSSRMREVEWATQSIGALIKRLIISFNPPRLPSSLLEMRILFEHRIPAFPGEVRGTADPSASLPRISC